MTSLFEDYERLRASGLFDADFYVKSNPDVAALNLDPLLHYLEQGARAGRDPSATFDTAFYVEQCRRFGQSPENPLLHFLSDGVGLGLKAQRGASPPDRPDTKGTTAPNDKLPLRITLDRLSIENGEDDAGVQLRLEGWAIAGSPIEEIVASIDGKNIGSAMYGLPRPDVGQQYPRYYKPDHSGFIVSGVMLSEGLTGPVMLDVSVRTAGDDKFEHRQFPVEIGTRNGSGIAEPANPSASAEPPMRLTVDRIAVNDRGLLYVDGWVVGLAQVTGVEVFADDALVGSAMLGLVRDDVGDAFPNYPNARFSGFALVADISECGAGRKTAKVRAIARGGISREVIGPIDIADVPRNVAPVPADTFHHNIDEIALATSGQLLLHGWAIGATATQSIVVMVDGIAVGEAQIGIERSDVRNVYPTIAHARNPGFAFDRRIGPSMHGEHLVTVRIRGTGGEIHECPLPVQAVDRGETSEPVAPAGNDRLKLYLDSPRLVEGVADTPVRNSLAINGWGLARAGVTTIDVAVDGSHITHAHYGAARRDVAAAFPDWENALSSGFSAVLPPKSLHAGRHTVTLTLRDNANATATLEFSIDVEESEVDGPWALRRRMTQAEIDLRRRILAGLAWEPVFLILLVVDGSDQSITMARTTIASLRDQAYADWRVLVVPRGTGKGLAGMRGRLMSGFDEVAERIDIQPRKSALAGLTDAAAADGRAVLVAVLGAGDEAGRDGLLELAIATGMDRDADFFYSDERRASPASGSVEAFFKPQWSPDLLLSTNYIGRFWCARPDLLAQIATTLDDLIANGDYDLVLRCTEQARAIKHVPLVLSQRSTAVGDREAVERRALTRAMARRGVAGQVRAGCAPGIYRVERKVTTAGRVSIIIPTCASRGLIEVCIDTLRSKTAYRNFEIVCIENIPDKDRRWKEWLGVHADKVITTTEPFNWSRFNNLAAAEAEGEFLLFLNDDIEIIEPGWLGALLEQAQRPEVGAVGPLLLYPDRRVQHAGMFLMSTGRARHAFRFAAEDDPGYFGLGLTQRDVISVTGACLLTRRDTFEALGRFDEAHAVVNNDLDYCLRAWRKGLVNVYTPHAKLIHHELASRALVDETFDAPGFADQWASVFLHGDPYHHPSLTTDEDNFTAEHEPTQLICAGHPMMDPASVRRILVVKLDHIGDCIIALPALRRLKQVFPRARLSVLAARSTRAVWSLEPAIDEVIEFDYFHSRSGLGKRDVTEEELLRLRERLESKRFDLAVDLRKNPDARHVLQYTGARFLAGFDYQSRFPWLDIALEWEGDPTYVAKRQQIGDDLVNLVTMIGVVCEEDRSVIHHTPADAPALATPKVRQLFRRPVVCVHPAVGTVMRQWPAEHFAQLIDLLVDDARVNIALIGGPDEEEVAASVMSHVRNHQAVWPFIGTLKLAELPSLFVRCALFVGNNSGPKHIAAGLGVPTVGIHSGVVDAREWGPMGPLAVAVRRDMSCSPCYFEKPEDCHRGLACLNGLRPGEVFRLCQRLLAAGARVQIDSFTEPS